MCCLNVLTQAAGTLTIRSKIQLIFINIDFGNVFYIFCSDSFICLSALIQIKGTSLTCCLNLLTQIHLILFNIHPDILHLLYGLCYSSQSVNTSCRDFINVLFQRVNTSCREIIKETKNSLDFILILILTIYQGQMSIFRRL